MMQFRTIEVSPVSPYIGAEISGIDLTKQLHNAQVEELNKAFNAYQVIFFRDQKLDYDNLKALGRCFGDLSVHPNGVQPEGHPEVVLLHTDAHSKLIVGEHWHTDVSCAQEPPLGSILYMHTLPPLGGDTLFASQYAAYEKLSDRMKAHIEGLTAFHDGAPSYRSVNLRRGTSEEGKVYPCANHPVVRTHPITKRKALYVNREFTKRINELDDDEGDAILDYLVEHSTNPEFQIRFHWRPHSVAFWDNRCTQHLAIWDYYPHTRSGFRVTIKGDKPY
jgi:alpha-ketoglutarate-dependent taurine dioxygenase